MTSMGAAFILRRDREGVVQRDHAGTPVVAQLSPETGRPKPEHDLKVGRNSGGDVVLLEGRGAYLIRRLSPDRWCIVLGAVHLVVEGPQFVHARVLKEGEEC